MNQSLAERIIGEIKRFSNKKYAVTDDFGEVLSKTAGFSIEHERLDIKGKKIIKLIFQGQGCGHVYIDENLQTVKEIGPIIRSMAELIIQQDKYTKLLTSDEKRIDQIVYDFFFSDSITLNDFIKILGSFGIDINKNRVAVLVEISDSEYLKLYAREIIEGEREKIVARTKRGIESILASFYTHHTNNLVFYIGGKNFLVLKDMGDKAKDYQEEFKKTLNNLHYNLKSELITDITIGVGNFKSGVDGIKESFEESRTALQFGKQIWGENKIFHYDNFGVIAPLFSGANKDNVNFSKNVIAKISKNNELFKTLNIYLENDMSLSKTSKILKIHRNTLVYRLEKIEGITDLDPRLFEDAFRLYMALILDRYHG